MAEIKPVSREHYAELSAFLSVFPGSTYTRELNDKRLLHWWDLNPAFVEDSVRGWLVEADARIVGFVGIIPLQFQLGGQCITAYAGTNWRVLPEFLTHSFELTITTMKAMANSLFFDVSVTDAVAQFLRKIHFQPLRAENLGRSIAVTSLGNMIQSYLPDGPIQRPFFNRLGTMMNWVPPVWLKNPNLETGLEVEKLDQAGEEFDRLWEATKHQYENTNVRTSEVINWYCFGNPLLKKELFGCYRHGELVGYQICGLSRNPRLKLLDCLDLWTAIEDLEAAKALLFASIDFARQNRLTSVSVLHFNCFTEKACHEVGMVSRRPVPRNELIRVAATLAPAFHAGTSYYVRAQGEYGL